MAQYISKSALVAEIEKRLGEYRTYPDYQIDSNYMELCDILSFVNTLEVKEVDFGIEICRYIGEHFNVYDDDNQTLQTKDKKSLVGRYDAEKIAKHFFELGMQVSNKAEKGEV